MAEFLIDYNGLPFPGKTQWDDWRIHPDWFNWRCEILLTRNRRSIKEKNT
jgi:hypothetical protein